MVDRVSSLLLLKTTSCSPALRRGLATCTKYSGTGSRCATHEVRPRGLAPNQAASWLGGVGGSSCCCSCCSLQKTVTYRRRKQRTHRTVRSRNKGSSLRSKILRAREVWASADPQSLQINMDIATSSAGGQNWNYFFDNTRRDGSCEGTSLRTRDSIGVVNRLSVAS